MPVLDDHRHEIFALRLAEGMNASEAYAAAGFKANRGNASTLKANQSIQARVAELQDRAAVRVGITIETLTGMYLKDREFAYQAGQPGAAIRAADSLAKLHGLWVDRKEIGAAGDFARMADEELETFIAERISGAQPKKLAKDARRLN